MGIRAKEHRKKVAKRNARLVSQKNEWINRFKKEREEQQAAASSPVLDASAVKSGIDVLREKRTIK